MLSHSLGKFLSPLCPVEISHVSACLSCVLSFHSTPLRIGFVSLNHLQIVGAGGGEWVPPLACSSSGWTNLTNRCFQLLVHGLQPPKHLSGLFSVCEPSLIMGSSKTGHDILDVALRWEEGNNHVTWFAGYSLANAAQYVVRLYHYTVMLLFFTMNPQSCFLSSYFPALAFARGMARYLSFELRDVPFGQRELLWWCFLHSSVFTSMSFPAPSLPKRKMKISSVIFFLMNSCASLLNYKVVMLI